MPTTAADKQKDRIVPDKIGKYEIINEIGKGTTGDVFLSHDAYYGRDVAVKVYHMHQDSDSQSARVARKMFFNEAHIPVLRSAKVRKSDVSGLSVVMPFELWSWTDEFDAPVSEMMDWKTFDIEHELSQQSPYTVAIENDGTAACRAELMFGKHQNKSDWIYFYVGTFIGGGVVLDQKLFAGKRGNAGGLAPCGFLSRMAKTGWSTMPRLLFWRKRWLPRTKSMSCWKTTSLTGLA